MALVDLALSKSERKAQSELPKLEDSHKYPLGTRLSLDGDSVDKLHLDECEVGDYVDIRARACIVGKRENETEDGNYCTVEIQIEAMQIEPADESNDNDRGSRRRSKELSAKRKRH